MRIVPANNIVCPIDGYSLTIHGHSLSCPKGHTFDIAKQGYLNLLIVQHKASKDPGDTKEMVSARTNFLDTGCYEPIAQAIATLAEEHLSPSINKSNLNQSISILDAGCGEGYYLNWLLGMTSKWQHLEGTLIGMDISKWAILAAAKRSRQITWIVGSNRRPPFLPKSIDLIICAFGFPSFEDFRHILKPGGKVIMVDPSPNHLIELRQLIYSELKERGAPMKLSEEKGFKFIGDRHLTFTAEVFKPEEVQNLFMMTPHYFRCSQEGKANMAKLNGLKFTVDVSFRVFAID